MSEEKNIQESAKNLTVTPALDPLPIDDPRLLPNPTLQTLWADIVQVSSRSDGLTQIRFFSKIPGQNLEVARLNVTRQTMGRLKGILEKHLEAIANIPALRDVAQEEPHQNAADRDNAGPAFPASP